MKIKLSASKIKTLQSCSWLFYIKYFLKLPDKTNSGALRGLISHLILEVLKKPRRLKTYNKIVKKNTIAAAKSVAYLVNKYIIKYNLTPEDAQMVDEMILVGLNWDYFFEGSKELIQAEKRFDFEGDGFTLTGFIDTLAKYKNSVKIRDFKTSKQKFSSKELKDNIQALLYLYIARKWYPELKSSIEFLFLRFPKKPSQIVEATDAQLKGIESYFKYLTEYISVFDEKAAKSDYAYDEIGRKWLCGAGKTWVCPYKNRFEYYGIFKDGKIIRSYFTKEEIQLASDETFKKMEYNGCPRHNSSFKTSQNNASLED